MTDKFDFTALARAGLSQKEFAELVGVNRVTANLWVKGKMQPHLYIRDKVAAVLASVEAAIETGKLPLPDPTPHKQRKVLIDDAVSAIQASA